MTPHRRLFRLGEGGRGPDSEIDDEIETHLALRTQQLVDEGFEPEQARAEAIRRLGGAGAKRALVRTARSRDRRLRRSGRLEALRRDLRLAFRRMRRQPGFAALAGGSLAVGIALCTTAFTVVDHLLLRPLALPDPDRLVALYSVGEEGSPFPQTSMENWLDWREAESLEASGIHNSSEATVVVDGRPLRVQAELTAGSFFETLRPPMVLGRTYSEEEAQQRASLAVVSEAFWASFLGRTAELPTSLRIDGTPHEVVGVVAGGSGHPAGTEVWVATAHRSMGPQARNWINWHTIARIQAGGSLDRLESELQAIANRVRVDVPETLYSHGVGVVPLKEAVLGDTDRYLALLAGAVAFVLLITCANLAGLSVARTVVRSDTFSVRAALGGRPWEIARQVVTEHMVLGLAGGALGTVLAVVATSRVVDWAAPVVARPESIVVDGRVLLFALGVSILAGTLAAAAPAVHAARASFRAGSGGSGGTVGRRSRAIQILVCTEVAVALVLLAGGGLLLRSFQTLMSRDMGFVVEDLVTVDVTLSPTDYRGESAAARRAEYWTRVRDELSRVPGVTSAAVAMWIPSGRGGTGFVDPSGYEPRPAGAGYRLVGHGYFETLGIPLLRGRVFDERDRLGSERVTVINQTMAERFWPGQNPIGQTVRALSMEAPREGQEYAPELTIVGVVGDVRHYGYAREAVEEMFALDVQRPEANLSMTVALRTDGRSPDTLTPVIRSVFSDLDPRIAVGIRTMESRLGELVGVRRFVMTVLTVFGVLGLLLAGTGVYGMLSFSAAQRVREMGLRSALGATGPQIGRAMLRPAARTIVIGAAVGLLASFWLTTFLEALLVDVGRMDPAAYGIAALVLVLTAALAAWLPARRAARVDPVRALRAGP